MFCSTVPIIIIICSTSIKTKPLNLPFFMVEFSFEKWWAIPFSIISYSISMTYCRMSLYKIAFW